MTRATLQTNHASTNYPTGLLLAALGLMLLGLVMIASTTASLDHSLVDAARWHRPLGRQLIFAPLGVAVMLLTLVAGRRLLASRGWVLFLVLLGAGLAVMGLLAALLPGIADPHRGSSRWLRIGVGTFRFGVQPSEPAKVALVGLLAWLLSRDGVDVRSWSRAFLPAALTVGGFAALIGKEDFGTAALVAGLGACMMFVAGCRWRYLGALTVLGGLGLAGLVYVRPYRWQRVVAFTDIWADPRGDGYQPIQSLTAIASGGWWGTGLGDGIHKYGYLPEGHTDFIFSAVCEEMGAVGGLLVLALYAAILWVGARAALSARSRFERLLAFGLTALIGLQAAMNVAVVTVLTPTTGIPLPLVSAGGSGLITFCFAVGLLGGVAARGQMPADDDAWAPAFLPRQTGGVPC